MAHCRVCIYIQPWRGRPGTDLTLPCELEKGWGCQLRLQAWPPVPVGGGDINARLRASLYIVLYILRLLLVHWLVGWFP